MTEPAPDAGLALRRAVLGVGLPGATSPALPPELAAGSPLLAWAVHQRVVGLLWTLARAQGSCQPNVEREWQISSGLSLLVESSVPAIAEALDGAGIEWRVLKGVVTSRLLYPDAGMRDFCDVDLLVRPADLNRALTALAPITAVKAPILHGPVRSAVLQERQITTHRGVEVDLHQAVEGSLVTSRLPIEPFFDRPQTVAIRGTNVLAPCSAVLFVHAVMHFSSAGRRLSTVPDIARLARTVRPDDPVIDEMLRGRTTMALFVWALDAAAQWVDLPGEWRAFVDSRRPRRSTATMVEWVQRAPARSSVVNTFLGGHRVRRAAETLWPSAAFLAEHRTTHLAHVKHLLRKGSSL